MAHRSGTCLGRARLVHQQPTTTVRDQAPLPPTGDTIAVPPSIAPGDRVLEAGRNCWRIERASRMAFLVDGQEYFGAVRSALTKARRSIFILGWDIDSRMRLVPEGAGDGYPQPLCEFLNAVVARHEGLRAYVLTWDFAMLYALEREWMPLYKFDGRTHRRLSFRLDDKHPVGASHHQKVIVVDDTVAFVSGFDLTRERWDTSAHKCPDPLRVDSSGKPYGPFHDLGAVVEGDCAKALSHLARQRWERATGRAPRCRLTTAHHNAWPDGVEAVLTDVDVAIARTAPADEAHAPITEVRQLHLDAIASARQYVFAENQYFTSRTICNAFAARLREPDGPEIAVISPQSQSGWLETSTMGVLRRRIHRDLKAVDTHDRYRLYCPTLPWLPNGDGGLNVHSKLLIVDDALLTIGSANLSDRSMALDTECNLAIEAGADQEIRLAIARLRDRLLAEHLDSSSPIVQSTLAREGSLHRAIAALLQPGHRALVDTRLALDPMVDTVTPDHGVFDPERPLDPDLIVADLYPALEHRRNLKARAAGVLLMVVLLAALALAWRLTPLGQWLNFDQLVGYAEQLDGQPLAPLAVVVAFVVGGLIVVPVTLLIAVTAIVFGPVQGALYSFLGATLSATVVYALGRKLGRDAVRRLAGHRLNELSRRLARRGLLAVTLVRIVPIAPFSMINIVAGASHIGWRDFLLGTMIGLSPGILVTSAFVDRAVAAMRHPGPVTFALLGGVVALIVGVTWFVRRKLDHTPAAGRTTPGTPSGASGHAA